MPALEQSRLMEGLEDLAGTEDKAHFDHSEVPALPNRDATSKGLMLVKIHLVK